MCLETLGDLAGWKEEDGPTARVYQASFCEESLRIMTVMTGQNSGIVHPTLRGPGPAA